MTPLLAVLLVVLGACVGAGAMALLVAAAQGDKHADVAAFLAGLEFSSFNQGRQVLLSRHDFNRLARLAAANQPAGIGSYEIKLDNGATRGSAAERAEIERLSNELRDKPPGYFVDRYLQRERR